MEGLIKRAAHAAVLSGAVGLVLMAFAGSMSANPFVYGNPAFCAPKKPVEDFGLSGLPPVREVPESAKGFGYGAVSMYGGEARVMPEPTSFGYGFSENNYSGAARLNWTVTAQLWTVDRRGQAIEEVDHDELFIGRLDAAHQPSIEVEPLEDRRGFYRFDMQIANKSGKVLDSYAAYFKVVRPSWGPRLRLSREALRSGEQLLIRFENHGSETISYGEPFIVQRFEAGAWVLVPDQPYRRWRMWLEPLGPGGIGRCIAFSIPADMPPGTYRIVKRVGDYHFPRGKQVNRTAPFEVLDPDVDIEY